jgi:beta-lactamase class A
MSGNQPRLLLAKLNALRKKSWFQLLVGALIFFVGIGIGWLVFNASASKDITITPIHDPLSGYTLIDPTLYTEIPESLSFPKYSALQSSLQTYVSAAEKSGKASDISVYYRDMNSNEWVGVNESQEFDPASMTKVVTLIALLRASEVQPNIMSVKISIPASVTIPTIRTQDYYPPTNPIKSGNTYTIPYLMQQLITQSDNGADAVLIDYLGNTGMATVYSDLHLPAPGTSTGISAQAYSHLFRVLYNSTYLTLSDSQKALQLLSQTDFNAGLVAGVPSGTVVAHKFGESLDSPNSPGLNDCGIIYYPNHPYFLCVMTKGSDFNTLAGVIAGISSLTWQQVSAINTAKS